MSHRFYSYRPQPPPDTLPAPRQPSGDSQPPLPPLRRERKTRHWLRGIVLVLLVLVIATGSVAGWFAWQFFDSTTAVFGGSATQNLLATAQPTTLNGESRGRINILITGNSSDDPGHPGGELTDSIMILSVDTQSKQAYILSVPRDLWVGVDGYRARKINAYYPLGQSEPFRRDGYPSGGAGLLVKALEDKLAIEIDYYTVLNYTAVRRMVDAAGGIDVTIASPDERGLFDPNIYIRPGVQLKLANGPQHLDGETALALMRARGVPVGRGPAGYGFARGDYDRTGYQRMVFVALQHKLTSREVISSPRIHDELFAAAGQNIKTDLKINEALRLGYLMKDIKSESIKAYNLAGEKFEYLEPYDSPTGEAALAPSEGVTNFSAIQTYVKSLR